MANRDGRLGLPDGTEVTVRSLPVEDWGERLRAFARTHRGWIADLGLDEPDRVHPGRSRKQSTIDTQVPLRDAYLDESRDQVVLALGEVGPARAISKPDRIELLRTPDGRDVGLRIETRSRKIYELTFRSAQAPDQVDGVP